MNRLIYYEATGNTKRKLHAMLKERTRVKAKMHAWAKKHGGGRNIGVSEDAWCFRWLISCEEGTAPNQPQHWKANKHNRHLWEPRLSTKEGKGLAAEMAALTDEMPTVRKMMELIRLNSMIDLPRIISIGVELVRGRLLVKVPTEKYKPPKGVALKRISDVTYDRLTTRKKNGNRRAA